MSFTNLLVPTYVPMLTNLSAWLDKAKAQMPGDEAEALLSARLADDMYPLATQLRFACVQALEAVHRLQGMPFPGRIGELVQQGRDAGERPGSIAEAQAVIAAAIAEVEALDAGALDADPDSAIVHELPNGMVLDLTAQQYARDWAIPQFYFHVMTAYAILRHRGVEIGKADYCAHVLPFLRPVPQDV
ncbi:DUF1993 family protein [Croceicoccus marinus]|uniref:DUF1993 domain-containing protein n=1 Tax=Croceicoccus marinus TaxID=450378 RepID=A0A1Z1FDL4_9SPHN|nr:DUF1993 domain-containing protein [Croceicoccus marinus]ARU16854.1 hypothetical protein A9D14_12600 [Croceicoccus marinus]